MLYESDMTPYARAAGEFSRDFSAFLEKVIQVPLSKLPKADQEHWKKRDGELHPSSFPYCPLRDGYERLQRKLTDPNISYSFDDDYYLNVGTIAHSALQRWIGMSGKVLGNFKCLGCGHVHMHTVRPDKCRHRGSNGRCKSKDFEYEEIGGLFGKHVHWHSDGLFKDKNGYYWIIDYKTSSVSAIKAHRDFLNSRNGVTEPKFPYKSNKIQIETYCILVAKLLGIKIRGWMLVYVARDYPRFYHQVVGEELTSERREVVEQHLLTADKMFPQARDAKKLEDFEPLRKTKLCATKKYYKEKIHDEWAPCPLYKSCFDKDKLEKVVEKEVKLYRKREKHAA